MLVFDGVEYVIVFGFVFIVIGMVRKVVYCFFIVQLFYGILYQFLQVLEFFLVNFFVVFGVFKFFVFFNFFFVLVDQFFDMFVGMVKCVFFVGIEFIEYFVFSDVVVVVFFEIIVYDFYDFIVFGFVVLFQFYEMFVFIVDLLVELEGVDFVVVQFFVDNVVSGKVSDFIVFLFCLVDDVYSFFGIFLIVFRVQFVLCCFFFGKGSDRLVFIDYFFCVMVFEEIVGLCC